MTKIARIANYLSDATKWTPTDMFHDALLDMEGDKKKFKKAMIIYYDDENPDNRQRIRWSQAGMKRSELINLLGLCKDEIILDMFEEL